MYPLDAVFPPSSTAASQLHRRPGLSRATERVRHPLRCAALADEEVDGLFRYHGQERDWLRLPEAQKIRQAIALLETLASARGLLRRPDKRRPRCPGNDRVHRRRRCRWTSTPGEGQGVLIFTGEDGTTSEGGQVDDANLGATSPRSRRRSARVYERRPGSWWVRDAGSTLQGDCWVGTFRRAICPCVGRSELARLSSPPASSRPSRR